MTTWVVAAVGRGREGGGGVFRASGATRKLGRAGEERWHRAAAPRRTTRTLGTQGDSPRLYDRADEGLTLSKQARHLWGQGDALRRDRGTPTRHLCGPPYAERAAGRHGSASLESAVS